MARASVCVFPEGNPCFPAAGLTSPWPVCSIQQHTVWEQRWDCGHGGERGRHRRLGAARETLVSHSHLSPCHHLPEHLPKASADFHKGKHSLSMAPALSVLDHSVPRRPRCPCQAAGRCPVTMAMLPRFTFLPPSRFIPLPHFPPTLQTSGRVRMQLCHQGCGPIAGSPRSGVTALDLLSARGESWNQGADTDKSSAVSPR